jgi:hypothetical protein
MSRHKNIFLISVTICLLVLTACDKLIPPGQIQPSATTPATKASASSTAPVPSATTKPPTDTPPPAPNNTPTHTLAPTVPPTVAPTPIVVSDSKVIYQGAVIQNGIATYKEGTVPQLDLLVKLGDTWYGPERVPNDGIDALALPSGFHWQVEGGFGCNPTGEAWWTQAFDTGTARLLGPDGQLLVTLPLKVHFVQGGGDDDIGGGGVNGGG